MWTVFYTAGGLLFLLSFVCALQIVIHAFRAKPLTGVLCLFIAPYTLYYAFAKFEHPKKKFILLGWLGAGLAGAILFQVATAVFGPDVTQTEGVNQVEGFEDLGSTDDL